MPMIRELLAVGLWSKIQTWSATTSGAFQTLIFFAVVALIALVLFGWVLMLRGQPHHHHHRHQHSHSKPAPTEESPRGGFLSRRRHRQRRKKHRPVNPTLAETGGLPEPRDSKTPPKSPL